MKWSTGLVVLVVVLVSGQTELAKFRVGTRDLATGVNPTGIRCQIFKQKGAFPTDGQDMEDNYVWDLLVDTTIPDGIFGFCPHNLTTEQVGAGNFRFVVYTEEYYQAQNMSTFYPYMEIAFTKPETENINYGLYIFGAPYGFISYRGSSFT